MDVINLAAVVLMYATASVAVNASSTHLPFAEVSAIPTLKLATAITGCRSRSLTNPETFQAAPPARDRRRDEAHQGHRLEIRGGLLPSASVAAQAGALDPGRAVLAAADGRAEPDLIQTPDVRIESGAIRRMPKTERCH
jgi:hypothetical protein